MLQHNADNAVAISIPNSFYYPSVSFINTLGTFGKQQELVDIYTDVMKRYLDYSYQRFNFDDMSENIVMVCILCVVDIIMDIKNHADL